MQNPEIIILLIQFDLKVHFYNTVLLIRMKTLNLWGCKKKISKIKETSFKYETFFSSQQLDPDPGAELINPIQVADEQSIEDETTGGL